MTHKRGLNLWSENNITFSLVKKRKFMQDYKGHKTTENQYKTVLNF